MWRRLSTWARNVLPAFRAALRSISDPSLARLFGYSAPNYAGVEVTEGSALGLSAFWRAVNLISGTLAQLPMRTLRDTGDGMRQRMTSFLDDPGKPIGLTPFDWKQLVFTHLLMHGSAYLKHIYGGAGQLLGLQPLHPLCVYIRLPTRDETPQPVGGKWFEVTLIDGTRETHDATTLTHVLGFSVDGIFGLSVISVARNSLGTAIAGDRAAAKMFSSGLSVAGIVSPKDELGEGDDINVVKAQITNAMTGHENAGGVAVLNRAFDFQQLTMSAKDAQFLESRRFSTEDVARWFGVPPHLLMQMDKQSSWAASIEGQQVGLARTVLAPWAKRLEEKLSTLLPNPRFVEFEFKALERPLPEQEIALLIQETDGGLMTLNEARGILNLPPVPGGEVLRLHGQPINAPTPTPEPEAVPSA